jgi:hypothetical protein
MRFDRPSTTRARPQMSLPFVVRPATHPDDLRLVTQLRAEAYGRHLPEFASRLRRVEEADHSPGVVVLLAQSKDDGRAVGTVRLQIDLERPLPVEASVVLPAWLRDDGPRVEPTRLAVEASEIGALARNAMLKASYLYAAAAGAAWIVAAARPPLDRLYEGLLFRDVFAGCEPVPMRHIGNLPHRVMTLSMPQAHAMYTTRRHRLAAYFFDTDHPDLLVDAAMLRPRALDAA